MNCCRTRGAHKCVKKRSGERMTNRRIEELGDRGAKRKLKQVERMKKRGNSDGVLSGTRFAAQKNMRTVSSPWQMRVDRKQTLPNPNIDTLIKTPNRKGSMNGNLYPRIWRAQTVPNVA
ncbi:hypothetical protein WR25_16577 [Diploscapter pachys]|uniref:Uncharacterized protein n=1 Tax=Diploscapter pachys TaxID=2018661 RepID=A0A2A2LAH7_9BILA|nr:hypothetical protein WR25_16577 [Diploscapter pachys]